MSLEKIVLDDFQVHEHLEVEAGPGVTTLVGPTDSGKSSVLRAVRWAALNRGGVGTARHGADGCKVTLTFDGVPLAREKRGRKNTYKVGDDPAFKAIGKAGLPPEVSRLAGLDRTNFQGQLDPPFLLSLSPADAARALNRVVDLGAIDAAVKAANAKVRTADARLSVAKERAADAKLDVYRHRFAPKLGVRARELAGAEASWAEISHRIASLAQIVERMAKITATKSASGKAVLSGKAAVTAYAHLLTVRKKRKTLERLLADLFAARHRSRAVIPDKQWTDLLVARAEGDAVAERRRALEQLVKTARAARTRRCESKERLEEALTELKAAEPLLCPACGRPRPSSSSPPKTRSSSSGPTGR